MAAVAPHADHLGVPHDHTGRGPCRACGELAELIDAPRPIISDADLDAMTPAELRAALARVRDERDHLLRAARAA